MMLYLQKILAKKATTLEVPLHSVFREEKMVNFYAAKILQMVLFYRSFHMHKGCYLAKAKIGLSHEQQMIIGVEYRYKW